MANLNRIGMNPEIRLITLQDAQQALDVYAPFVKNTAVTFEYSVPTLQDFTDRIITNTVDYPWLVCIYNNTVLGYAYGSRHRYKTAYQWSVESTIYLAPEIQNKGIGKIMYNALFSILKLQGYYSVFAGVALPNEGSEKLHTSMGFEEIGVFNKIGFKLNQWHDVKWFQLDLKQTNSTPHELIGGPELHSNLEVDQILKLGNEKLEHVKF